MTLLVESRNGPLCPMSGLVRNELHNLHGQMTDAYYEALAPVRDDDGELPEDLDRSIQEHVDRRFTDYMRLYETGDGGLSGGRYVSVTAHYWQCPICGFVLPATEADRR